MVFLSWRGLLRTLLVALLIVVLGPLVLETAGKSVYPFRYRETILDNSRLNSLDPRLVAAVIRVESGFRPETTSKKGARGLMQIMPETGTWAASRMGVKSFDPGDLYLPETSIKLGTWYLADLHVEFGGRLAPALAAYNGGRGNVERWLKEGVWDGRVENLGDIPFAETRAFVRRVLGNYQIYRWLYPDPTRF